MYDFSSFDNFISSTNGQTIGGGEAVDYVNLIWQHLGSQFYTYPPDDPSATDHAIKWGVLNDDARNANIITGITYIANFSDVKRGDIVILTGQGTGHGGYINEDYHGSGLYGMYSQNVGEYHTVGLDYYDMLDFGGAFRYSGWNPTPTPTRRRGRFPWVLYARKLRNQNRM